MQRIGHLRAVLHIADVRRRTSMENLATRLHRVLEKRVQLAEVPHDNTLEWLAKRQQVRKYGDLQKLSAIALQDAYLSDPSLPSFTGTVTTDTAIDIVRWASHYNLLRPENLTLSPVGQLLRGNEPPTVADGFSGFSPRSNPYLLDDVGARFLWAVLVVAGDALVLGHLLPRLPRGETFSRTVAGDLLGEVLLEVSSSMRDPKMLDVRNSIRKSSEAIQAQSGTSKRGLREHHIAVRLEPLVDVGLLSKPDPYRWEYRIDGSLTELADELIRWGMAEKGIVPPIGQVTSLIAGSSKEISEPAELWRYLYEAHVQQRSPVGFAGIDETILTGICLALREGSWFGWESGVSLIRAAQSAAPKIVRFNVDRYGNIRHIKLPEEPPPSIEATS